MSNVTGRLAVLVAFAGLAVGACGQEGLRKNGREVAPAAVAGRATLSTSAMGADSELPIRRITLYRSGVGSFERRGVVDGDSSVQLRFKTEQINDILKSMVVLDLSGKGTVDGISYGSKEPLNRRLGSFAVDISGNPTMGGLLAALRGSAVIVTFPDTKIEGVILGVETKLESAGKEFAPVATEYLNLVTSAGIRSIKLSLATAVELKDKELNAELSRALATVAEYRADRTKTVEVNLVGTGERECVVAYVQESPVWKTSYRLVLPEGERRGDAPRKVKSDDRFTMQAWAIVENTTDEDWSDVRLSLVAGRPVSFRMDLYEPLYVYRPEIAVPTVPGVLPRMYAGGVDYEGAPEFDLGGMTATQGGRGRPAAAPAPMETAKRMADRKEKGQSPFRDNASSGITDFPAQLSGEDMAGYAARSQGSAAESGEVFMYEVDHPVTVERQRSAMIPLINAGVDGRRVSIYNAADGGEHPMRGLELKNSTNLQLMPGPISVFDGAAYAGDSQIGHVPAGDKRLLAYAVDLEVTAVRKDTSNDRVRTVKIVRGVFEVSSLVQSGVTYTFANKDDSRDRMLIVEQARLKGSWTLAEPKAAYETTDDVYRFEAALPAGKTGNLKIVQETVQSRTVGLLSMDLPTLLTYSRQGQVSEKVITAFKEAQRLQSAVAEVQRRIATLEGQRSAIDTDQNRLRQNMNSIDRNTELYKRYLNKLTEQETKVEQLAGQLDEAREALRKAQTELDAYVQGLSVD